MLPHEIENITALIELAKKHGIKSLKYKDFVIEFLTTPGGYEPPSDAQPTLTTPLDQAPTEDDLLMWSAGGPLPSELRKVQSSDV